MIIVVVVVVGRIIHKSCRFVCQLFAYDNFDRIHSISSALIFFLTNTISIINEQIQEVERLIKMYSVSIWILYVCICICIFQIISVVFHHFFFDVMYTNIHSHRLTNTHTYIHTHTRSFTLIKKNVGSNSYKIINCRRDCLFLLRKQKRKIYDYSSPVPFFNHSIL